MKSKFTAAEKKALRARNPKIQQLIYDMVAIKHRAGELEIYKSMHAIDKALSTLGWQYAEILTEQKKQGIIK